MKISKTKEVQLLKNIRKIIESSRNNLIRTINETIVKTYFEIGRIIIENEQQGKIRAEYSEQTINYLALQLSKEFGKGFSGRKLRHISAFYVIYKKNSIFSFIEIKKP